MHVHTRTYVMIHQTTAHNAHLRRLAVEELSASSHDLLAQGFFTVNKTVDKS